jgi:Uma2 family endonuclease
MGIPEYWIVDYAALGGRNFLGTPKQPTISVCRLVEGEYQIQKFRDSDRLLPIHNSLSREEIGTSSTSGNFSKARLVD